MPAVAQILKSKSDVRIPQDTPVVTIDADDSVFQAVKMMSQHQIGALVVTEGGSKKIVGIVTERDYARKVVLMDRSSKTTPVRDIMTANVLHVHLTDTSEECMAIMTQHRMRHLPVIDEGRLVGMVSIGDLVKNIISEQQLTIQQLEHYITGAMHT
jgi:IMP dehydrogenase